MAIFPYHFIACDFACRSCQCQCLIAISHPEIVCRLHDAKTSVVDREARVRGVIDSLEQDLELIGLSGVEDKLQVGSNCFHRRKWAWLM